MNNLPINVIYEDNHLIVVNKRSGDIVQGDKTGDTPLSEHVKAYIKKKYNKPGDVYLGTVHRLDRPTTGIVLFAKTSKALTRMNKMFAKKAIDGQLIIKKTYWAVTEQKPKTKQGTLINFLRKNEKQNKSYVFDNEIKGSKLAELSYLYLGSGEKYHFIEISLKTGRHHQIRTQLANIGCVIKGDLKYGAKRSNKDGSIHLHARLLEFMHPVKKELLTLIAPVPNDTLWQVFEKKY